MLRWILRYAWAAPNTLLGLVFGALILCGRGARVRVVGGVLEFGGGALAWLARRWPRAVRFDAITFGHVVLGVNAFALARTRAHERVHVRQYERWGALFLPAYLGASAWLWLRGRDAYRDNPFEREAYRA